MRPRRDLAEAAVRSPFRARAASATGTACRRRCRATCAASSWRRWRASTSRCGTSRARRSSLPVFRLLGGTRTKVHTYAVGGMYRPHRPMLAVADELAAFVRDGYRAVKLKSGALSLTDEVARIRAVRDAIGPDVELMLDCNAGYDVTTGIEYANAVAPYDITWFEEPLHWYLQPADYVRLAQASPDSARARRARVAPLHRARLHRFAARSATCSSIPCATAASPRACASACTPSRRACWSQPHSWPHLHAHLVSALGDACYGAECVGDPHMHPVHHRIFTRRRVLQGRLRPPDRVAGIRPGGGLAAGEGADRLTKVEAVEVHHLGPCGGEVLRELRLRVGARIHLGERAQLRVRAEDQIDARARPPQCASSCGRDPRTGSRRPAATRCACRAG